MYCFVACLYSASEFCGRKSGREQTLGQEAPQTDAVSEHYGCRERETRRCVWSLRLTLLHFEQL